MKRILLLLIFFSFCSTAFANEKIRIVTTTSTFASITESIAQGTASIHFVASPKQNVHFISPTPKDVLKVKKADVFIHGGLDLEVWRMPLLEAAGNTRFLNDDGVIDASNGIELIEVPETISRAEGDIHVLGNPHYWTDPLNGRRIAETIASGLSRLYPEKAAFFETNKKVFQSEIDQKLIEWNKTMDPLRGTSVITYHKTWSYFAKRFGLNIVDQLEPKPGIAPTAKHIANLIQKINTENIRFILKTTHHESTTPRKFSQKTGVPVLALAEQVSATKEVPDYFSMIDYNINLFKKGESAHD